MDYKTYPCGCKITEYDEPLGIGGASYSIEFCSLHTSASRNSEALEFYADENNWEGWVDHDYMWTGEEKVYLSKIENDRGEIARRALAGEEY